MPIQPTDIVHIDNAHDYKLHLSAFYKEEGHCPLDAYCRGTWHHWNQEGNRKDNREDWNRKFIFSLIQFDKSKHTYLFGGIFAVIGKNPFTSVSVANGDEYVGRLIIHYQRENRPQGRAFNLENFIKDLEPLEILLEPYRYKQEETCICCGTVH